MPTSRRITRLEQLILETVAVALQRDVHDPRIGIVSVTRVQLAPDLSVATVWWSCLGDEVERRTTTRGLAAATRTIQSHVAKAMGTRVTPRLTLRFDAGFEKAQRLEGLFDQIRSERGENVPSVENPGFPDDEAEVADPGALPDAPAAPDTADDAEGADEPAADDEASEEAGDEGGDADR